MNHFAKIKQPNTLNSSNRIQAERSNEYHKNKRINSISWKAYQKLLAITGENLAINPINWIQDQLKENEIE